MGKSPGTPNTHCGRWLVVKVGKKYGYTGRLVCNRRSEHDGAHRSMGGWWWTDAERRPHRRPELSARQLLVLRNIRQVHLETAPRSWIRTVASLERRGLVEHHGWAHGWERTADGDKALQEVSGG